MTSTPNLRAHFGYAKFKSQPYRLLFPHIPTFELNLQASFLAELRRQGHEVVVHPFRRGLEAEEVLRTLLRAAVETKPDAILTLNGLGLDNHGRSLTVLSRLGLPVVTWYMDNHMFMGPPMEGPPPEWAMAFSYERTFEGTLRDAGFQHVFYLPLATDRSLPPDGTNSPFAFLEDKISYVGNTFSAAAREYHEPEFERLYAEWQPDFSARKQAAGRIDLVSLFAPFRDRFAARETLHRFMGYVAARETLRHRRDQLASLAEEPLVVFGPHEWRDHLPEKLLRPPVGYKAETPWVYRSSAINLSLTTMQHETALNQRYYDVPMCGGFLLGEWQDALPEQFEPDREVISFRNQEELLDKARYYREHPEDRERIVGRARERVLKEHLMEHRVATMLAKVREVCNG